MKTLAFDTSTKFLSVACLEDGEVKASFHEDAGLQHSRILIPTIKRVLDNISWRFEEVGLICAGIGPGSFTGIRIAVAVVKGLALVSPVKVVGVPSMDAISLNAPDTYGLVAPLLDARKGKVYTSLYKRSGSKSERVAGYSLVTIDELLAGLKKRVFFFGDAVNVYKNKLDLCSLALWSETTDWYPKAVDIGRIGIKLSDTGYDDPAALEPLYLHAKECGVTGKKSGA